MSALRTVAVVVLALAVGAGAGYAFGASGTAPGVEVAADLGAKVRQIYEGPDGIEKLEQLTALYAEGAVIDDTANGDHFDSEFELEWANKVFLETPDLDMVIERIIADDGVVALCWRATGTNGKGDEFDLPGVTVYELDGELIGHEYYYYNERQAPTF